MTSERREDLIDASCEWRSGQLSYLKPRSYIHDHPFVSFQTTADCELCLSSCIQVEQCSKLVTVENVRPFAIRLTRTCFTSFLQRIPIYILVSRKPSAHPFYAQKRSPPYLTFHRPSPEIFLKTLDSNVSTFPKEFQNRLVLKRVDEAHLYPS